MAYPYDLMGGSCMNIVIIILLIIIIYLLFDIRSRLPQRKDYVQEALERDRRNKERQ